MIVTSGAEDVTTYFVLRDASDGTALTGATITSIDLQYVIQGAAPVAKVDATALAATDSDHANNKAIEVDATDQPGLYRVDWPDAAFVGDPGTTVVLTVKYSGAFTEHLLVEIEPPVDATRIENDDALSAIATLLTTMIETYNLDHLAAVADDDDVVDDSILGKLAATDGDWSEFAKGTDSLQAIRDRGDSAWPTATSVTVSDKTGFKLASDGLDAQTAWTVDITGNITGTVSGNALASDVTTAHATTDGLVGNAVTAAEAAQTRVELALPAVAPDGVGGLPISDAGGLDLDAILADTNELQADWHNAGRLDTLLDTAATDATAAMTRAELALPAVAPDGAGGLPISDAGGLDMDAILTGAIGAGDTQFVYTLTSDADSSAIVGALVRVSSDADGETIVAAQYTNDEGKATFWLNSGTYYFWRKHGLFAFSDPDVEIVG